MRDGGAGESAVDDSVPGCWGVSREGSRGRTRFADEAAGGGLGWRPVGQVRDKITWVPSLPSSVRRETLVSRSRSCCAVGRLCGSLASVASTIGRSASGTAAISGSPYMIRYKIEWVFPAPNGDR